MKYVIAAAETPIIIISNPLQTQFFLEKMVFMAPTPKRVKTVPVTEAIRASHVLIGKAKGNIGTMAARPKETPHKTPALTGFPSSLGDSPSSSMALNCKGNSLSLWILSTIASASPFLKPSVS